MKKYLLVLCLTLAASSNIFRQQYWSKRYDIELGNEYGSQVIVRDDGFLVFMWGFGGLNNAEFCYGIIKFDLEGEKQWQSLMYDTIGPNAYISMAIRSDTIFVNTRFISITTKPRPNYLEPRLYLRLVLGYLSIRCTRFFFKNLVHRIER